MKTKLCLIVLLLLAQLAPARAQTCRPATMSGGVTRLCTDAVSLPYGGLGASGASVSAGFVFAGPCAGMPASATFRVLCAADIPVLDASKITSGTLSAARLPVVPIANGGTNSAAALNNNRVLISSGGAVIESGACTSSQVLVGGTPPACGSVPVAAISANTIIYHTIVGNANGGMTLGGTCFLTAPGVACSGTEQFLGLADRAGTARNLRCFATAGPGGARTSAYVVRQNAANTTLTCAMVGASTTCTDVTNTFSVAAGDRFSISDTEELLSGIMRPLCSFVVTN